MGATVRAEVVRRGAREEVIAHLARDARANLFLLDMAARLGERPAPGELRTEIAVARSNGAIRAVAGLRPSIALDAEADTESVEALLPYVQSLGVGLVKSDADVVARLWAALQRRAPRRAIVDRQEIAYALRSGAAELPPQSDAARPARADDLEALVFAARESLREEGRPDPFAGDPRGFRRWVRGRIPRARVVQAGDRVAFVGYADVQRPDGWLIQGVYTWPEARGRGLAKTGVAALCREAFAAGTDHVQLAVVEDNVPALRVYERLGFEAFSRLRTILFTDA